MPAKTIHSYVPEEHAELLNEITRDIIRRPRFFADGWEYLQRHFGPNSILASEAEYEQWLKKPVKGVPVELPWRAEHVGELTIPIVLARAFRTFRDDGLPRTDNAEEEVAAVKAVLLLAFCLWYSKAESVDPMFEQFDGLQMAWRGRDDKRPYSGREMAAMMAVEEDEVGRWKAVVGRAWERLAKITSPPPAPAEHAPSTSSRQKAKKSTGRPPASVKEQKRDARLYEASKQRAHKTNGELGRAFGMTGPEVKKALQNHRVRMRRLKKQPE